MTVSGDTSRPTPFPPGSAAVESAVRRRGFFARRILPVPPAHRRAPRSPRRGSLVTSERLCEGDPGRVPPRFCARRARAWSTRMRRITRAATARNARGRATSTSSALISRRYASFMSAVAWRAVPWRARAACAAARSDGARGVTSGTQSLERTLIAQPPFEKEPVTLVEFSGILILGPFSSR